MIDVRLAAVVLMTAIVPPLHAAAEPSKDETGVEPVIQAARSFVRAVGDAKGQEAYALTSPAYQAAHTREQFDAAMAGLRENVPELGKIRRFVGYVSDKPAKGDAKALVFTNARPAPAPRGQRGRRPAPWIGLELTRASDTWLVANIHETSDYKVMLQLRKEFANDHPNARGISSAIGGEVTKVDAGSVTIADKPQRGDGPAVERTLAIDDNTEVMVIQARAVPNEQGTKAIQVPQPRPGKLADVQVGMLASMVELSEDGKRAESMMLSAGEKTGGPGL